MKNAAQSLCVPLLFLALAGALDANSSSLRELSASPGFEANDGQLEDERTQYLARLRGYVVTLDSEGASLYPTGNGARTRLQLEGASRGAELAGEGPLPGRVNYFLGHDQSKWRSDIPAFARVRAKSAYRGVDVVYYRTGENQLEHDFVIAPGGRVEDIRVAISGADHVRAENGEILVQTASGEFRLKRPVAFQEIDGRRHRVPVEYVLANNRLRFRVGKYDHRRELVIDPVLVFSRFIGGSNEDDATDVVADSSGNVFVVGVTYSTNLAVVNSLPNYGTLHGSRNLFISKLNSGGVVLFTTYLGGGGESGAKAAVDPAGNLYLVGTGGGGFPTTQGAYKTTSQGSDFFVTKVAASGASLLYSTFVGGSGDESGYFGGVLGTPAIAVDSDGNAYVSGRTNSSDFPVVNGNPRPGNAAVVGGLYAFELNAAGSALAWSTYIANEGIPVGVALDGNRNLLFTGIALDNSTLAATPMTATGGAFQTSKQGADDGYVGKLSPTGSLLYLTFLGGSGSDDPIAIAADASGNAYVTGQTLSTNFPTASAYQSSCHGALICLDTFVTKLNSSGSGLVFSTYLGGTAVGSGSLTSGADRGQAIAVDSSSNVWVAGYTSAYDFPLSNSLQNACGQASAGVCSNDAYVAELSSSGSSLLFSTYFGGTGDDSATGIAVNANTDVFVAGSTASSALTTKGQATTYGGNIDGFALKIAAGASRAELAAAPQAIAFQDTIVGGFSQKQVTLVSAADQTVTVSSIATGNAEFPILSDTCTNVPLATGTTCTFLVRMAPTSAGAKSGTITIGSNAIGSPLLIPLSGNAYVQPNGSVSPTSLLFSGQAFQTTSAAKQVTLTNIGNGVMTIVSIATTGDYAHPATTCGATLDPSASCTIDVTFTPTGAGTRNGTLTITTNAPNSPHTVGLSGTGLMATASLSPTSLSFSAQILNTTSAAKSVTLTNTGGAIMHISNVTVGGAGFSPSTGTCGATLAVSASCTIAVTFTSSQIAAVSGSITITHDGTNSPNTISLSGTGQYPPGTITSLSPAKIPTGWPAFTLTVNGSNFYPGLTMWFGGSTCAYTYISSTQITCVIGTQSAAANIPVFITNPTPVGSNSNTVNLVVATNSVPQGAIDSAVYAADGSSNVPQYSNVTVSGWAGDPDDGSPVAKVNLSVSTASATPNSGIYVTDGSCVAVKKVDPAGGVSTYAGNSTFGFSGDNGPATSAALSLCRTSSPGGVAYDSAGNIYVADTSNMRVRKVTAATGTITTIAGTGAANYGANNIQATTSPLYWPFAVAVDPSGNVYVSEDYRVRKVAAATGIITTVAGTGVSGFTGDTGAATSAKLSTIGGLATDSSGNLYISDLGNHRVRRVTIADGKINTIAGSAAISYSGDGGPATSAGFAGLGGIAVDGAGNVYVADWSANRVRKFTVGGNINTIAGPGTPGILGDGGPATSASLASPYGIAPDSVGNLLIADTGNGRIRKVDLNSMITTVAGGDGSLPSAYQIAVIGGGGVVYSRSGNAILGGSRPDVASNLGKPEYASSGWTGTINIGNFPPGTYTVRATAVDRSNGSTALGPEKTITVVPGTGSFAEIQSSLNFPIAQLMWAYSAAKPVTLSNTGNAPLVVSAITITGDFVQSNNCGTVPAGGSCTINVSLHPTKLGPLTGTLTVSHNAADATSRVSLSGEGTNWALYLSRPGRPKRSDANLVRASESRLFEVMVASSGNMGTAQLSCLAPQGTACEVQPTAVALDGREQGVAALLRVRSVPPAPGLYTLQIFATTSGDSRTLQLPFVVAGEAAVGSANTVDPFRPGADGAPPVASTPLVSDAPVIAAVPSPAELGLSVSKLNFGEVRVGKEASVRRIGVHNPLSMPVTVELSVEGEFSAQHDCGEQLAPGGDCHIEVRFLGVEPGSYEGRLRVRSPLGERSIALASQRVRAAGDPRPPSEQH